MSGIHPGEPEFGPWTALTPIQFGEQVLEDVGRTVGPVGVVAVDGRSGGGKTTSADRLAPVLDHSVMVHTDDVGWHHSFFEWSDLMILVSAGQSTPDRSEPRS